jgi:DNA polymerase-1
MPTLHLIDGSGYIFRAYHALPPLTTSKGMPTGAVRGVAAMLLKDLREQNPTHIAVCMDLDGKVKRSEIYPEYKAHRPAPPDDLVPQFALVRDVVRALNLPMLEVEGYEADDVIATLARQAQAQGFEVVIVSGDKDLMQLVRDGHVRFYDGMKDAWFDDAAVREKWGVAPAQVGDLLALVGDSVDNIPGVPGVGPKTAASLLLEHGTLEAVLAAAEGIKKPKLRENLVASKDQVRLARRLVQLVEDVDVGVTLDDLARQPIDPYRARAVFSELEMFTLLKDLPQPPARAANVVTTMVRDAAALDALVEKLRASGRFALRVLTTGPRPLYDAIIGFGFGLGGEAFYVPVGLGGLGQSSLPERVVLEKLKPLLEAEAPLKDGHALKNSATTLARRGIRLGGLGIDVEMASFLVNAARREHVLEDLAREKLGEDLPLPPLDSRKRPLLASAMPDEVAPYAGAGAHAIARMAASFEEDLRRDEQWSLYETVERPLMPVLAAMEVAGIRVDTKALREQSDEFEREITRQLVEIEKLAGGAFNVNAPAQLAEVLFERLQLPVLKKGKTGPSTDHEVLEKLAEQHPLPAKVLEYRSISKLKNTYLDTLPELVGEDGRIHTTFNMVGAATGRLSSNDPNLQNIPIRTELGKRIRAAFVAAPGSLLVSADYSQIELRILAHVSGDAALTESFSRNEDVHTRTAAEIYGVLPLQVTGEMRRVAKMINYAIAYGLSAFGLATRIDIPGDEARRVIEAYFARYAGVKAWLDRTIEEGRARGYVSTLLGRRRQLADLRSKNPQSRMAAERAAVNAPIQGTAADIVKLAMLEVDRALRRQLPEARMLLQVHDELLFEVPEAKVDELVTLVRPLMEHALELKVPLVVDVGHGRSWAEAH